MTTHSEVFPPWAPAVPELGAGVYRLTSGPQDHKHAYHKHCPWSPDGTRLLLLRHDREQPVGEVCLLDLGNGDVKPMASTTVWRDHEAANQQWAGERPAVLFHANTGEREALLLIDICTGVRTKYPAVVTPDHTSPDGRFLYGRTPLTEMFPQDGIAPRHDKGLARLDLDTGETSLLVSLEQLVSLHPDPDTIASCHNYVKQTIVHRRTGRLLFVFGNDSFYSVMREPHVKILCTVNPDGSDLRVIGPVGGHPMWHPVHETLMSNMSDANKVMRFMLQPDRPGAPVSPIPTCQGGGHPTWSPDGRFMLTDEYDAAAEAAWIRLINLEDGREHVPGVMSNPGSSKAGPRAMSTAAARGQGIVEALTAQASNIRTGIFNTHCHPVWSRSGGFVLFNSDHDGVCQLYLLNVEEAWHAA
jgi:hypothetical protein